MHLELPKARLDSIRDFLKHYLMIVLSILTALGLEAWIEHAHHTHAASLAQAQIEAEIRANLAEVQSSLEQNAQQAEKLTHIRDALVQDVKTHAPHDTVTRHVQALVKLDGFDLNMSWPTLRQQAWDVAVANQSASWIDDARMRRFSAAYAGQRDMATTLNANLALILNGPRMVDAMTDLRTGQLQPREFLHVVGQMAQMQSQAITNLQSLKGHLEAALTGH